MLLLRLISPLLSMIVLIESLSCPLPCSAFIVGFNNNQQHPHQITTTRSMITTNMDRRPPFLLQGHYPKSRSRRRQKPTISSDRSSKRINSSETQLSLHPLTATTTTTTTISSTVGASLALIGSSLFGIQIEKIIPSSGILATLLSSAFFGNFVSSRWVPTKHPLYDLCFTLFLPGSLALLLLAYRPPSSSSSSSSTTTTTTTTTTQEAKNLLISPQDDATQNSISACIIRIAMPFFIASVASLFGCWLSYRCALAFRWFHGSIEYAKITTGCMSASYVGGSVNFMSTARSIGAPANLLGSLVTSDLLTMSIYFSFLSSSLDWKWLVSKFSNTTTTPTKTQTQTQTTTIATKSNSVKEYTQNGKGGGNNSLNVIDGDDDDDNNIAPNLRSVYLASIPLLISTYLIVNVANRVENVVGRFVPGAACAIIAIVAPILNSLVQNKKYWTPFSIAATAWSDFFFLSFFASIGIAANLSSALSMGPACLLFSTIALTVHVLGTTFGCVIWNRLILMLGRRRGNHNNNILSLDLEDVWIASNAAIGGPATAAAFCGRMKKRDPGKLQGRTIAATVWGVVGYAIGTFVGVSMYRMI
jgi:uncharacterized membrane protein